MLSGESEDSGESVQTIFLFIVVRPLGNLGNFRYGHLLLSRNLCGHFTSTADSLPIKIYSKIGYSSSRDRTTCCSCGYLIKTRYKTSGGKKVVEIQFF